MAKDCKSGKGFCSLCLKEFGNSLLAYRLDDKGKPIINEKDVLIIKPRDITYRRGIESYGIRLALRGQNYQFLREDILKEEYNEKRSKLSREDFERLKQICERNNTLDLVLEEKI